MQAYEYWKVVAEDKANLLDQLFALLERNHIRYCVIGGQAVNAYADPVVSLDLDIVIALEQIEQARQLFATEFSVTEFAHSLNITLYGSKVRVQIQTDPRYFTFVDRASRQEVLGLTLPVAAVEDVLQGKIWAFLDPQRRASMRQKDLADITRLIERYPPLRDRLPEEIQERLLSRTHPKERANGRTPQPAI